MKHSLLSSAAERLYWLGRYIERAENTARLIMVNAGLLMEMPARLPLGWRPLIDITDTAKRFDSLYAEASERNVCRFLTCDSRYSSAITSALATARENARTVRETMPRVTFEYINDLHDFAHSELTPNPSRVKRRAALNGLSLRVQRLEGFLSQNMLHDTPWQFLRLGNHIERADMTTRIIDVRTADLLPPGHDLAPFQEIQWRSVLISLFARQSYHATTSTVVQRPLVLEFLLSNFDLPRSYAYCLRAIRRGIRSLPRNNKALSACNRALHDLQAANVGELEGATLHRFIDNCQTRLGKLHTAMQETWFRGG